MIATFNIRNTQDRYTERQQYLKQTIQDVQADIMGLQEVAFGFGGQLDDLVVDVEKFVASSQIKFHECNHPDPEARLDGNTVIIKQGFNGVVASHELLHISAFRVVQKLKIEFPNTQHKLIVINSHLHHTIEDSLIRLHQITHVVNWIQKDMTDKNNHYILLGDFNFTPASQEYKFLQESGFKSSYKVVNGEEPKITFPTGLTGPYMDVDESGTFDYIWFKSTVLNPIKSTIFGEVQLAGKEGIYPSDHMGVTTDFEFNL